MKGKGCLIAAGVINLLIGTFCGLLIISSIVNNASDDEGVSLIELFLHPLMIQLVSLAGGSLVLGILLLVKCGKQKWGNIFMIIGVIFFIVAIIIIILLMLYLFFPVLFLLVIPVLMMIGGALNKNVKT